MATVAAKKLTAQKLVTTGLIGAGLLVAIFGWSGSATSEEQQKWLDLKNCAICQHMGEHEELMKSMKWETHLIKNGMMSVAIIPDAHKKTMQAAHKAMEKTIERLESGEPMELCGFCSSYGQLMKSGATTEDIDTTMGKISLLTSTDQRVVKAIHKHAEKTIKEYKKILQQAVATGQ